MPLFYTNQTQTLGVWKITETWQELLATFPHPEKYVNEVDAIKSDKRKQEWLAVRLLLNKLMDANTAPHHTQIGRQVTATDPNSQTNDEPFIHYHKNGSPFLPNRDIHISISHTVGYATLIINHALPVGIDIEYRSERAWRLREKFMNNPELSLFSESTTAKPNHADLATLCWCAKETAFKALQQNEVDFIKHLHIQPFPLLETGVFTLKETKTPRQNLFHIHYQITDDYILSWL